MSRADDPTTDPVVVLTTLVVEDDPALQAALQKFLHGLGHEVLVATTMDDALQQVRRRRLTCALLDVGVTEGSGADLVSQILELEPYAAILMLTGVDDAQVATDCLQQGALDYLVKPVDLADLERAIARALSRRIATMEQEETQAWLKQELVRTGAELQKERGKLEQVSVATLETLVNALEAKNEYLRGHSGRIANLSAQIAVALKLTDDQIEAIRTGGRLHDIGKIGIRESVLNKQGALTDNEFDHVRTHVTLGAQILAPLTQLRDVISFVRSHHERVDGLGYPDKLSGDAIPLGARIIGAAEVYDALTTSRPYQDRMTATEAVNRMGDLAGTVLDPKVVEALKSVITEGKEIVFIEGTER